MMKITLGDFEFEGNATSGWVFQQIIGWFTLSDSKAESSKRPISHGSFSAGYDWRDELPISFDAVFLGADAADAENAARALNGIAASPGLVLMSVEFDSGVLSRMVSVKAITVDPHYGEDAITVHVDCVAPDPLAYGPEVTATTGVPTPGVGVADPVVDPFAEGAPGNLGRVALANTGTASTSVRIDVAGGLSGGVEVQCIESGQVLRLVRLIPDGSVITFNSRTGRASIDGQSDVTGFMTVDEWMQIPPGETRTFMFTPLGSASGTPSMTVTAAPAFF